MANKSDLESQRVVSREEGERLASSNSLDYFECSVVSFWGGREDYVGARMSFYATETS